LALATNKFISGAGTKVKKEERIMLIVIHSPLNRNVLTNLVDIQSHGLKKGLFIFPQ
jgi:hypothetical protein